MTILAGIDIGGTKCAVSLGSLDPHDQVRILAKERFETRGPQETQWEIQKRLENLVGQLGMDSQIEAIGISCGGPLDSQRGRILSPPNLPGWDDIDIVTPLQEKFHVPVGLQNDANACALAEWQWGAGRGCQNMIFLTFGTGMGAGLILDGRLYSGSNDMAGEVGHIRMAAEGPLGYGKAGSLEGFCSGGGIARLAKSMVKDHYLQGGKSSICGDSEEQIAGINAQLVSEAALEGDELALRIMRIVGVTLGQALSFLVDILNPEKIVIGSIYLRQRELLEPIVLECLKKEALPRSLEVCQVVPAGLGELVGDYASLSVARYLVRR
jgi:glucokinase